MDPPESVESVGHVQCYCPVLQRPRIAIHHGIWRDLIFSIRKYFTELNDAMEHRWLFPSALKPGSTRGVGFLQDPRIYGTTRDPTARRVTKQKQTQVK